MGRGHGEGSKKTRIKPGQVLNPKGRPRVPDDLKEARAMRAHDFEAAIYKHLDKTADEIKEALISHFTPATDLVVLKILAEAISKGDHQRLDFLLNRTIGKVKEQIDHNVNMKPSILVKTDGTEVHFIKAPADEEKK